MYNDYRGIRRTEWQHTYLGKELLPYAEAKRKHFSDREIAGRSKMSKLMDDRNINVNDPKVKELQAEIESTANEAEQCAVFVHEFKRKPEREFSLSLGDVVYFGLITEIKK